MLGLLSNFTSLNLTPRSLIFNMTEDDGSSYRGIKDLPSVWRMTSWKSAEMLSSTLANVAVSKRLAMLRIRNQLCVNDDVGDP
jgi:hypothetical protein